MTHWPLSFMIAHRGASQLAPENTIAALKKAKEQGAQSVEFDVQLTKDHQPVVFHDATLLRTTNGCGHVSHTSFSTIKTLDAGEWFSADYQHERIPTLAEWLQTAANLKLRLNLEIKCDTKKEAIMLADLIMDHLKKYWPLHSNSILISSGFLFALTQIIERTRSIPVGFITEDILSQKEINKVLKANIASVHQQHDLFSEKYIQMLHENELVALAYTVNDLHRVQALQTMGIDGIFTDNHALYGITNSALS